MAYICISKLAIIGSGNGLSSGWRQAIIWTNAGILLIGPLGTNFCEILIEIYKFSFKKIHLKMLFGKWWPSCLSLNVLTLCWQERSMLIIIQSVFYKKNYSQYVPIPARYGKWFNSLRPNGTYIRQWTIPSLVQIMACCLFGDKPSSEPMTVYF